MMYEYRAKLQRVVDGDTIDVTLDLGFDVYLNARIRLYGINTPETRTRDLEEKKRGLAAKERLIEILSHEENFIIQSNDYDKGKYGRILGTIIIEYGNGPMNVNEQLIEEGHAVRY